MTLQRVAFSIDTVRRVCLGDSIKLSVTVTNGVKYSWTGPNSFTSNIYNPAIKAALKKHVGRYYVKFWNSSGCWDTSSIRVSTGISGSIVVKSPFCRGDSLKFSTTAKKILSYSWFGPNRFTSNIAKPVITNATKSNVGTYYLAVVDSFGCTDTLNNNSGSIIPPEYVKVIPNMGLTREGHTGNLLIHFRIEFPEKLSEEKINALREIL